MFDCLSTIGAEVGAGRSGRTTGPLVQSVADPVCFFTVCGSDSSSVNLFLTDVNNTPPFSHNKIYLFLRIFVI